MTPTLETRDVGAVDAVRQACLLGDGTDPLDEATGLRLKHDGLTPGDRLWSHESDGIALALSDDVTPARIDLSLAVSPHARGQGIASALLTDCLSAPSYADAEWFAWSHGDHPAARQLALTYHFANVRELWVMRMMARPTDPAQPIAGLTIRSYQPGDAVGVLEVNAAAFAAHPEQGAMDATNLAQRMAEAWFDPQGLFVAVDPDHQVLGFHWTKLHPRTDPAMPQIGEVYVIGVSPQAHGQGLGRRLMGVGLQHLCEAGAEQIILYVEADNAPALALYASLGFTHDDRDTHVLFHRPARPA